MSSDSRNKDLRLIPRNLIKTAQESKRPTIKKSFKRLSVAHADDPEEYKKQVSSRHPEIFNQNYH